MSEDDLITTAQLNTDNEIVVGQFELPLVHGAGQPEARAVRGDYSQLFRAIVLYELTADSSNSFLAVKSSVCRAAIA